MAHRSAITAIILCGGRATRLGGVDKPLLTVGDKALLEHVIDRVRPQVDALLLSCGIATPAYEAFGHPVVEDRHAGQGPLGGFVSALPQVRTPWVLTTPADTPFLPDNLVASLAVVCGRAGAAVVTAGGHRQNLAMLLDAEHSQSLAAFYEDGGRAIHRWLVANAVTEVDFPAGEFLNVNTPDDLAAAEARRMSGLEAG
ncbi:MAG: molybdenum cofactor guanylyltransferase [Gammaproteobacteria bacterium]|nr:molybdenum cofactor guanylyltransferase [Gammaproteobacteria bacterium]